jgi:hypothetical protein
MVAEVCDEYWRQLLPGEGAVGFFTKGTTAQFDEVVVQPSGVQR